MNEAFERHRRMIVEVREQHAAVSYRQRMLGLKRGDYESEDEALDGIESGPFSVSDDEVYESLANTLDMVKTMREKVRTHGHLWARQRREQVQTDADRLEMLARDAFGLEQARSIA